MSIDTFKKLVFGYLVFTGAILLIAASLSMNGFAVSSNPAWVLVKSLRTILLWVGGVPTVLWVICKYFSWRDQEHQRQEKEWREEIEKMIMQETSPLLDRCYSLSDQLTEVKQKLADLVRQRQQDQVVLKELEEKQNRTAEESTDETLSEFI